MLPVGMAAREGMVGGWRQGGGLGGCCVFGIKVQLSTRKLNLTPRPSPPLPLRALSPPSSLSGFFLLFFFLGFLCSVIVKSPLVFKGLLRTSSATPDAVEPCRRFPVCARLVRTRAKYRDSARERHGEKAGGRRLRGCVNICQSTCYVRSKAFGWAPGANTSQRRQFGM